MKKSPIKTPNHFPNKNFHKTIPSSYLTNYYQAKYRTLQYQSKSNQFPLFQNPSVHAVQNDTLTKPVQNTVVNKHAKVNHTK